MFSKSHFENNVIDNPESCSVCVYVCLSLASDSSETIKIIMIKLGMDMMMMVTASEIYCACWWW